MVFSDMHDWQGEPGVKQILVFPSEVEKKDFEIKFAERVNKVGIEKASDSGIGADYKLRAVKNGVPGSYSAIIRSGVTGDKIVESWKTYSSVEDAMRAALEFFREHRCEIFNKEIKSIDAFIDSFVNN